jgi:lipoprotein-anchoring transpeptidase ErfK/SrfK
MLELELPIETNPKGSGPMGTLLTRVLALVVLMAAATRANAHVEINIDLSSQTMTVHSGSGETYVWPISSGKAGHATPRGVFRPRAMYVMVHSAKYDNAPMPHSIFFHGQYAIHGTTAVGNLGRPASHGCVRISPANAATLFAMVQKQGADIRIVGSPFSDVARGDKRSGSVLGFAPIRHTRTLKQWARDPLGE